MPAGSSPKARPTKCVGIPRSSRPISEDEPMLEVNQLVAGYAGIVALRSASLSVPRGAMVCLVGANGAGKSTLLNTISGLISARSGAVRFDGADITRQPAQAIARQGLLLVPEGRQIFGALT